MKEIVITSSVLILCIMLIRTLFKGKVSSRLLYALWLLAVLRLVIPVSAQIGPAGSAGEGFRVMDLVRRLEEDYGDVEERLESPIHFALSTSSPIGTRVAGLMLGEEISGAADGPTSVFVAGRIGASWLDIIRHIWHGGMAVIAVWMIITNIIFYRRLHGNREELKLPEEENPERDRDITRNTDGGKKHPIKIYVTKKLTSPCLYGFPGREAIYLTPDIAKDKEKLRHVLTHELCHRRHGDSLWSIVRSALVTVYWMNPLVWAAAVLSKRDCELACDESALLLLGEEERIPYGETLLSIIVRKSRLSDLACTATTMTGSGKSLKERIGFIAGKPKVLGVTVAAVAVLAAAVSVFVFTKNPVFAGNVWEGEITLTAGDMQVSLPASIAGISSYGVEEDGIVIYQTASGREAGRFLTIRYEEAAALADAGREMVLLGDYGQNPNLRQYMAPATEHTYHTYTAEESASGEDAFAKGSVVPGTDSNSETTYIVGEETVYLPAEKIIEEETVYLPAEQIITVPIPETDPEGACYIYLKADYSDLPDRYREQMEDINVALAAAADRVIVLSINRQIRKELFATLAKNRTQYLGDAPRSSTLAGALPEPDGLAYKGIALHTLQTEPETGLSLDINYELTAESWERTDNADMIFFNAVMLFATIKNLDQCNFVIEDTGSVSYDRVDMEETMGALWSDDSASAGNGDEAYEAWLEELYARVTEYLK